MIDWGIIVDGGDIQTAFAEYAVGPRGVNTFFSAQLPSTGVRETVDPHLRLPQAQNLGDVSLASALQYTQVTEKGSGYGLFERDYPGGKAFLNMTGTMQEISLPANYTDWNGNPISTLALADAKGTVVFGE